LTTPPALSVIGSFLKRLFHAQHFIWEMDIYPDIAVDLDVLRPNFWITHLLGFAFDRARYNADGIIVLGTCMRERLIRRGVPGASIHIAENWADGKEIQPVPFPPNIPLRILYSGNLGLAHDVDTIRAAIHLFKTDCRFLFDFSGAGPQRNAMESSCRGYENVSFSGYKPRQALSSVFGACHVGLVTQKAVTLGSVVPSKTYGLMAAGRPILYIGPREATPARIIERFRCGWQVDPGDHEGLVGLLERLSAEPNLVSQAGARGRIAFEQNYDLPIGVARVASIIGALKPELVGGGATGARKVRG